MTIFRRSNSLKQAAFLLVMFGTLSCGDDKTTSSIECSADCNGALPVVACAVLDSSRYSGGEAICTDQCTVSFASCVEIFTALEGEVCTGGDCVDELACRNLEGVGFICVQQCNPVAPNTCGGGRECREIGTSPTDGACFDVGACMPNGATRCVTNELETCTDHDWVTTQNCTTTSASCAPDGSGGFYCAPNGTCDEDGHAGDEVLAWFDPVLFEYYGAYDIFIDTPSHAAVVDQIHIEIWPGGPTMGDSTPITINLADEVNYDTCTFCVSAYRDVDQYGDEADPYMPTSGTVTITQFPTVRGDPISLTFHDTVLSVVGGNKTWCLDDETYTTTSTYYACDDEWDGYSYCFGSDRRASCTGEYWVSEMCDVSGEYCVEASAECESPPDYCNEVWTDNGGARVFFDDFAMNMHTLLVYPGSINGYIYIDNYFTQGGLSGPASVDLSLESDPADCLTCVWGWAPEPAPDGTKLWAQSGGLEISYLPEFRNDPMQVVLTDVELREIDGDGADVTDGDIWCIPEMDIWEYAAAYPCDWWDVDLTADDMSCAEDNLIECVGGDDYDALELDTRCGDWGESCIESEPGTAACWE